MSAPKAPTVQDLRQKLTDLKSIDQPRTMHPGFYTSDDFHELEKQHLFRNEWVCLGHVGEIPNGGDFFTTELVGEQFLVSHGHDGKVYVLSNVCYHRGNLE